MIALENVSKAYPTNSGMKLVLNDISIEFPERENIGILGQNGAGKSTLLRILAGVEPPDVGTVHRTGSISWPIGFSGGFSPALSGEENCRFISRIYGHDVREVTAFAYDFSELGEYFFMPIKTYSSGMRARLAFGLSMAIDFNYYLVDEVTAVGDSQFQRKCRDAFRERQKRSAVIIVSHSLKTVRDYCSRAAVLIDGELTLFDDLDEAAEAYES